MRLIRFIRNGQSETGVERNGEVLPLSAVGIASTIQEICGEGKAGLAAVTEAVESAAPSAWIAESSLQYALPIERPGKIVCLGLNYRDHAIESGHSIPEYPALFLRVATSLLPHKAVVKRPLISTSLDYEAELMIVIGLGGRHLTEDNALDSVFGYTVFNDVSVRDFQFKSPQWTAGKNFDGTGPVGPAVVTADELPLGAEGLRIQCRVNGETLQDSNTGNMIFSVRRSLVLLSEIMTLEPGDLVALGTPSGVGFARKPPVWLKAGDVCEIEIDGIGVLRNTIADDMPASAA